MLVLQGFHQATASQTLYCTIVYLVEEHCCLISTAIFDINGLSSLLLYRRCTPTPLHSNRRWIPRQTWVHLRRSCYVISWPHLAPYLALLDWRCFRRSFFLSLSLWLLLEQLSQVRVSCCILTTYIPRSFSQSQDSSLLRPP